jgi:putative FmdB family regulatory protein
VNAALIIELIIRGLSVDMPIYEYRCTACSSHFEKRQSISEDPLKVCEKCGGALEKQWSLSGFQFKGAGWYVTDYSKKNGSNGTKSDTGEKSSGSESTVGGDSASKPETGSSTAAKADTGTKSG